MAEAAYGSLPFREMIAFFRRKLNLRTQSWLDVYAAFLDADGLVLARTAEELAEAAARLIADPARRACQSAAAATVVERLAGAVGRTARAVLDRLGPAERQP